MSAYCVDPLIVAGIKVIILEYDLCPEVTLTELVEQVSRFGEFLLKNSDYANSRLVARLLLYIIANSKFKIDHCAQLSPSRTFENFTKKNKKFVFVKLVFLHQNTKRPRS